MSWTKEYPQKISKNELRGKALYILDDHPPEPSSKTGLLLLIVTDHVQKYKILVTDTDIQNIIDIAKQNEAFTFDDSQPYATVCKHVPTVYVKSSP